MKILSTIIALLFLACTVCGQPLSCEKTVNESLLETAKILNLPESKALWNVTLNAPVILVDPMENIMYFLVIENGGVKHIKEEPWDHKVPLANSFSEYDGQRYVTIIKAALTNASCERRINLIAHEIFHFHQNSMGIENVSSINYHMDETRGRALLQIEMKALQQTLEGDMASLHDALYIRAYRQMLYPDNNEDLYELNEGLAEYTGMKLSESDLYAYAKENLDYDIKRGYTNAFGYFTGSTYALLLDKLYPEWRYDKDLTRGMIYLIKKKHPQYAITIADHEVKELLSKYNYQQLLHNEEEEMNSFGSIALFEELLKPETSKICIENNNIRFTYNPHDRVIVLSNGVLLRNMTLMGEWGKINARNGILRLNNWSAFYLSPPDKITENRVEGNDYTIDLNSGWIIVNTDGIYRIIKKE